MAPRTESAPLPAARVRVLTRRPALAESLSRHASALGFTVITDDRDGTAIGAGREDVILLDAGSRKDSLESHLAIAKQKKMALVIAATAAEARGIAHLIDARQIVHKPVQRGALHDALAFAMGAGQPTAAVALVPVPAGPRINGHVLLVEDEAVNAAVAQGYLAELGCTSVWVKDGTEAVARSAAERFDLILMDLSMPKMDGFATTALIRQGSGHGTRVPIVPLSAHDAHSCRDTCITAGMDDMLSKPYTLEECAQMLRRWLPRAAEPPRAAAVAPREPDDALASVDAKAVA